MSEYQANSGSIATEAMDFLQARVGTQNRRESSKV